MFAALLGRLIPIQGKVSFTGNLEHTLKAKAEQNMSPPRGVLGSIGLKLRHRHWLPPTTAPLTPNVCLPNQPSVSD